ncbi:MAG: tRNA uridine-5-carboxymethylaminomethyl(34) synthesis GTPase MnmE [Bdellovibrionales bacterium]
MALFTPDRDKDTICALATPPGRSGIAVLRVSGSDSFNIVRLLCASLPTSLESHRIYFAKLRGFDSDEILDEVLVSCFEQGKSFTGEESVEISTHGNPVIIQKVLQSLILAGCRPAERGEFTYRAFLNQKIDLVQAESVLNVIEAESSAAASLSLRQLDGELSKVLAHLEDETTYCLANIEASIDFTEEDIEIIDYPLLEQKLSKLLNLVRKLLTGYRSGRILKEGLRVSFIGRPNAGKSSLLNSLLSEERAIVSNIPGTTRDVVEGNIQISGVSVSVFDTAGLHDTTDKIEQMGIQRSEQIINSSDIVFYLIDLNSQNIQIDTNILAKLDPKKTQIILTKSDLLPEPCLSKNALLTTHASRDLLQSFYIDQDLSTIDLLVSSSTKKDGISDLLGFLEKRVQNLYGDDSAVVSQARHFELLGEIDGFYSKAIDLVRQRESSEFISFELHESIFRIHELLGKRFDDEVMDRVFKEFCIGK